jgi:hypothetical protein
VREYVKTIEDRLDDEIKVQACLIQNLWRVSNFKYLFVPRLVVKRMQCWTSWRRADWTRFSRYATRPQFVSSLPAIAHSKPQKRVASLCNQFRFGFRLWSLRFAKKSSGCKRSLRRPRLAPSKPPYFESTIFLEPHRRSRVCAYRRP